MISNWFAAAAAVLIVSLSRTGLAADAEGAAGLSSDVDRIVAGQESEGWFGDDDAFRDIAGPMLESTCRATPEARAAVLADLQARSATAGDPRALFAVQRRLTDAVKRALNLERQRRALELTLARVDAQCPFWLPPKPGFIGLQSDRRRWTLSLETAGNVQLRETERHWDFGAGGFGRVLPGYGFSARYTLLFGVEFGGGAMVKPHTGDSQFIINYFPALPVVLRTHLRTWHYEFEVAPVALFQADNTRLSYGIRGGGGIGFTTLRHQNFLPWAGLNVSYEHYFAGGGRSAAEFIRSDLRVGFVWDP